MIDGTRLRCPGCHATVAIFGDAIERHHVLRWESVETVEMMESSVYEPYIMPITIERRLECGYSGARVRVKR